MDENQGSKTEHDIVWASDRNVRIIPNKWVKQGNKRRPTLTMCASNRNVRNDQKPK